MIAFIVLRFARPWQTHERLATLWEQVAASLGTDWSLPKLARLAGCSPEHLRRLCHRQLGRSPKHHYATLVFAGKGGEVRQGLERMQRIGTEATEDDVLQEEQVQPGVVSKASQTRSPFHKIKVLTAVVVGWMM